MPSVCPVKATMPETTALGAAMAAGAAEGVNVWNLSAAHLPASTTVTYQPQINPEGQDGGMGSGKGFVGRGGDLVAGDVLWPCAA